MTLTATQRQVLLTPNFSAQVPLTLSGNEITDLTRLAGLSGDGATWPDESYGIWPAATNLNDNGNATTNTTGITDTSSTTTRATSGVVKFGTTAFNVVSGNAAANEGPSQLINGGLASTQYTVSAWAWLISGAATVRAALYDTIGGKQGGTAVVLTATPQKIQVTATTGALGITESSFIETTVQQAGTWRCGGWQVETGAVATPYIPTDGADASRPAGRPQLPVAGLFTPTQGAFALRARMGYLSTTPPASIFYLFDLRDNDNNRLSFYYDSQYQLIIVDRLRAGVSSAYLPPASWALLIVIRSYLHGRPHN